MGTQESHLRNGSSPCSTTFKIHCGNSTPRRDLLSSKASFTKRPLRPANDFPDSANDRNIFLKLLYLTDCHDGQ